MKYELRDDGWVDDGRWIYALDSWLNLDELRGYGHVFLLLFF